MKSQKSIPRKRPMKSWTTSTSFEGQEEKEEGDDSTPTSSVQDDEGEDVRSDGSSPKQLQKQEKVEEEEEDGGGDLDDDDLDEDDSDEDDSDEDEDEEDETANLARQRASKRPKSTLFVDDIADVDDEDEDDEDYDEEVDKDFIDEVNEAKDLQKEIYRAVDQRRQVDEDEDANAVAERLKQRYGQGQYVVGEYRGDAERVPMQFLLPTAKDGNLWLVKCKPGRERDIAMNLMRKYLDYEGTQHQLQIKAVVARETLKGYIYVEARSMADVQLAIDKVNNIYASKITLIPREEMVDVLTIRSRTNTLKPGAWVRCGRGKYKGDLAQVLEVTENNEDVRVKLIPRIDYNAKTAKARARDNDGEGKDRKRKAAAVRPPQRFFNHKDVDTSDRTLTRSKGYWVWGTDWFDKNGFLEKEMKMVALQTENITPTLDELSKFSASNDQGEEQQDLISAISDVSGMNLASQFHPGDLVAIVEGDLINAQGTVLKVEQNTIVLQMKDEALGEIYIEPKKLTKLFQLGDHVKVVRGRYKDDMGMITQVNGNVVTVFSDLSMQQFSVFMKDIQSAADVSITENQATAYRLHDFVQLGPNDVAVIIKVEREQYRVLDQNGIIRNVKMQEITQKRDSRRAVSLDANQNTIQVGDAVEILMGEHAKRQGTILHLYRTWVFVHNNELVETSGVFVVRARMVRSVRATEAAASSAAASNGGFAVPAPFNRGGFGANRRDELLHKTVVIAGGPHKGYQGIVKSVTEKGARVELHTNAKVVTVPRNQLATKDGGMTPMVGSKTPNVWGGAQTPSYEGGHRTPAWDAGAKTPAWDAGAKTPAWDAGAKTPMHHIERDFQPRTPVAPAIPTATSGWEEPAAPEVSSKLPLDWLQVDLEVRFLADALQGLAGFVTEIFNQGRSAVVMCPDRNRSVTVEASKVEPVPPSKRDRCMLISGEKRGQFGKLIGMDHDDAIVKLDSDEDFTIEPFKSLCKVHQS